MLKHYSTIMPLPIHYYNSSHQPSYTQMPRKAYAAFKGSSDELTQKLKAEEGLNSNSKEDSDENTAANAAAERTEDNSNGAQKGFSLCE